MFIQTPRVLFDLRDCKPFFDVPGQHRLNQVNATLTHDPGNAQLVVQDLVNAVEGVFFIYESV